LTGRVALITGGDSGIGRAVALAFAGQGADVCIGYYTEHDDARRTASGVEGAGRRCLALPGDIRSAEVCRGLVGETVDRFGRLDILVNNAAVHFPRSSIEEITPQQLRATFEVNLFSMFYLSAAALPHLRRGRRSTIINTTSVTAYRGSADLVDYAATKGGIVAFTRSLAQQLASDRIRVNAVAPGPVWTPLIAASFDEEKVSTFGSDVPMGRAAQPRELAGHTSSWPPTMLRTLRVR
jgi:NAD(P)-dependent dehydrogenase (short-subunit alcohol dehydrogenase family)